MRLPSPRAFAGVLALGLAITAPAARAYPDVGDHHPLWPTEVRRIAEPLLETPPPPESQRLAALRALDRYATPLIADILVVALADGSPQIRREVLQRCAQRAIQGCVPAALALWRGIAVETSNRLYALRVLLLDPTPEHVDVVLAALRDNSELLRIEAARLLGVTPLPDREGPRVRAALVAKLADPAADVRRTIARSLGILAAAEATLVLARMLEDPDPAVRRDAGEALGMIGDPRALPALERALDRGDDAYVARTLLDALALQPGEAVDRHLLEVFDNPPRGISTGDVARAIGGRTRASPALLDGLLMRTREPQRAQAIQALLGLGDQAIPAIEAALQRGVEDEVAIELGRLVRARKSPAAAAGGSPSSAEGVTAPPLPAADDRRGWQERLTGGSLDDGAALVALGPEWLAAAIADALERPRGPHARRPWLVALALASSPRSSPPSSPRSSPPSSPRSSPPSLPPSDPALWGRVLAQAADRRLAPTDRCLATLALGRAPQATLRAFGEPLRASLDDRAQIRACKALALGAARDDATILEGLLVDRSPRVRAAAALAIAAVARPSPALRSRLALAAEADDDGRVRAAAAWSARALDLAEPMERRLVAGAADPSTPGWMTVEADGERFAVPALVVDGRAWVVLRAPTDVTAIPPAQAATAPYRDDEWME